MKTKKLTWKGPLRRKTRFGDAYQLWHATDPTGQYFVRMAKFCDGVRIPPPYYTAIRQGVILSRHKTKQAAMNACERHSRAAK